MHSVSAMDSVSGVTNTNYQLEGGDKTSRELSRAHIEVLRLSTEVKTLHQRLDMLQAEKSSMMLEIN